jgi:CRISPR-associated endoribonuclease Cas6
MTFDFYSIRFVFSALDPIHFPPGQPGNILRGAFGNSFRGIVCSPDCPGARECPSRESCDYARIFEPAASAGGPSGLRDRPRPFVFRASYLDGKTIQDGERFWFDVHLFETRNPPLEPLSLAFGRLAKEGLGPLRGRADLVSVEQRPISIALEANGQEARFLRVEFLTPTELKTGDRLAERPEFEMLFARARDRVSALRTLYGAGPLEIDFRAMGERAATIRMTRCKLRQVKVERHSSRTGQVHGIGGFVGAAEYEGALTEFLPYLEAAQWTGIGRHCGWGNGEFRLKVREPETRNEKPETF